MRLTSPLSTPFLFPAPLEHLKLCVTSTKTYLKADSRVIFVCGAQKKDLVKTRRDKFMEYANHHLKDYRFFRAEEAFLAIKKKTIDLLTLEQQLADYCDCIIIILESHGAVAELGAFMMEPNLAKIVLAINNGDYKGVSSFINDGPLAKANRYSKFGPMIYTNFESILSCAEDVKERLAKIQRVRNQKIDLSTHKKYINARPKDRMLFIADLIHLFSPITPKELLLILQAIYGKRFFDFKIELAMLRALGLLEARDLSSGYLVRSLEDRGLFYSFAGIYEHTFRGHILNSYHKKDRDRFLLLFNRSSLPK